MRHCRLRRKRESCIGLKSKVSTTYGFPRRCWLLTSGGNLFVGIHTVVLASIIRKLVREVELHTDAIELSILPLAVVRQICLPKGGTLVFAQIFVTEDLSESIEIAGIGATEELIVVSLLGALRSIRAHSRHSLRLARCGWKPRTCARCCLDGTKKSLNARKSRWLRITIVAELLRGRGRLSPLTRVLAFRDFIGSVAFTKQFYTSLVLYAHGWIVLLPSEQ